MVANDDGTRAEWADVWFAREAAESAAAALAHSLMQSVAAVRSPTQGLPRPTPPPLAGLAVLVTRAAGDADGLVAALRTAGAEPVLLPTIQIVDSDDLEALDAAIDRLQAGGYDWVVFTSQHAVKPLVQRLGERGLPLAVMASAQIAAVGSATAAWLDQADIGVDLVPDQYTAEHVLAAMISRGMAGRRVLFPRGDRARDRLPSGLAAAGATVDEVVVYRTVPASDADPAVLDRLRSGGIDVVTLMSPSSVQSLASLLEENLHALTRALVACIGPVTAAAARELGLRVDVVPERSTAESLVEALADHVRMAAKAKGARPAVPVR
jgi:uroporphyrinogen-III synthase